VARIREKFGFAARPWVENKHVTPCAQLSLGWDAAAVAQQMKPGQSCAAG
jgi:hypothetical protein